MYKELEELGGFKLLSLNVNELVTTNFITSAKIQVLCHLISSILITSTDSEQ